jgi:hypothetical protein
LLKVLLVSAGKGDPSLNHWYMIGSDPVTEQFNIMDSPDANGLPGLDCVHAVVNLHIGGFLGEFYTYTTQ